MDVQLDDITPSVENYMAYVQREYRCILGEDDDEDAGVGGKVAAASSSPPPMARGQIPAGHLFLSSLLSATRAARRRELLRRQWSDAKSSASPRRVVWIRCILSLLGRSDDLALTSGRCRAGNENGINSSAPKQDGLPWVRGWSYREATRPCTGAGDAHKSENGDDCVDCKCNEEWPMNNEKDATAALVVAMAPTAPSESSPSNPSDATFVFRVPVEPSSAEGLFRPLSDRTTVASCREVYLHIESYPVNAVPSCGSTLYSYFQETAAATTSSHIAETQLDMFRDTAEAHERHCLTMMAEVLHQLRAATVGSNAAPVASHSSALHYTLLVPLFGVRLSVEDSGVTRVSRLQDFTYPLLQLCMESPLLRHVTRLLYWWNGMAKYEDATTAISVVSSGGGPSEAPVIPWTELSLLEQFISSTLQLPSFLATLSAADSCADMDRHVHAAPSCLVHCRKGASRSPTVVALYYMKRAAPLFHRLYTEQQHPLSGKGICDEENLEADAHNRADTVFAGLMSSIHAAHDAVSLAIGLGVQLPPLWLQYITNEAA